MFVIKKRTMVIVVALVVTAITFAVCFGALYSGSASGTVGEKIKIVLDAGHGGIDAGVSGRVTGVNERELNLDIVKKLERHFISAGFSVTLTRNSEAGLYGPATSNRKKKDMQRRKEIINNVSPTLVISVHLNYYSVSTRRGAQVFYKNNDEQGEKLAKLVQNSFNEMKTSTRNLSALTGDYYILNCCDCPAIIAECGYLSNLEEEKLLTTSAYREELAYTIFKGTIDYLSQGANGFIFER